jgi:hypothetical protein
MARRLPLYLFVLFVASLLYDAVIWGALPSLPDIGRDLRTVMHGRALLADTYTAIGRPIDAAVPTLLDYGTTRLERAFEIIRPQMLEHIELAPDLVFGPVTNTMHRWIRISYWFPPVLLVATLLAWVTRPRKVSFIPHR